MEYLQKLKRIFHREKTKEFKEKASLKEVNKIKNSNKEGGKSNMAVKESYALVLGFKNSKEKTCTITIDNVKDNLTQDNITPVMDAILKDNIITTSTGNDLISKVFAKVVAKTETDYQYE